MTGDSRIVDIIRQVGAAEPASIKLNSILQSPEQDFFAFSLKPEKSQDLVKMFELLARSSINIRFFNSHRQNDTQVRIQLCVDIDSDMYPMRLFQTEEKAGNIESLHHHMGVRILSLYPFSGQAKVAERLFSSLRFHHIGILAANCTSSVISCVIAAYDCELATVSLRRAFVFP
jgi:aspartokinase